MSGRVAKIPISNTFSELVDVDVADYGDLSTSLHIRGTFSLFSAIVFLVAKKKKTSEIVREGAIPNRMAFSVTPEIIAADKDSGFTGKVFQDFCNARKIALQTVMPGSHQCLGANERRRVFSNDYRSCDWK